MSFYHYNEVLCLKHTALECFWIEDIVTLANHSHSHLDEAFFQDDLFRSEILEADLDLLSSSMFYFSCISLEVG